MTTIARIFELVISLALVYVFTGLIRAAIHKQIDMMRAEAIKQTAPMYANQFETDWFFNRVEECRNDFS